MFPDNETLNEWHMVIVCHNSASNQPVNELVDGYCE